VPAPDERGKLIGTHRQDHQIDGNRDPWHVHACNVARTGDPLEPPLDISPIVNP
jgi:hypothetical protein